jgi:hypothetical protein
MTFGTSAPSHVPGWREIAFAALLAAAFAAPASERIVWPASGFGQTDDAFGAGVAIRGDTLAIGVPYGEPDATTRSGAIAVYRLGANGWQSEALLRPGIPVDNGRFGAPLALGQDLIVSVNDRSTGSEAIYDVETFERDGTAWSLTNEFSVTGVAFESLALSGDTLLVSNYGAGTNVYTRSGSAWAPATTLAGDQPDEVVEVATIDGAIAVLVGSNGSSLDRNCFVHFFSGSGATWTLESTVALGESFSTACGAPLAISGETVLVGHIEWNVTTPYTQVDAYFRDQGTWSLQGALDAGTNYNGAALAIEGDRAIVGSPGDEVLGNAGAGSAYVFERTRGAWARTQHLYDPSGAYAFGFGSAVALAGDTVLAGSPGAITEAGRAGDASVIALGDADWTVDDTFDDGDLHASERFGTSVAGSGSTLVVGAPLAIEQGSAYPRGAAYVFAKSAGTWEAAATLRSTSDAAGWFGGTVALDASTLVVGAAQDDDDLGAAYVFIGPDWTEAARLTSDSGGQFGYGWSVAVGGQWAAVGEPGAFLQPDPPPSVPGIVHLYTGSGSTWTDRGVLLPSIGDVGDTFGYSLAMSGDTLIVGAPLADDGIESEAGLAFVFVRTGDTWTEQARLEAPVPAAQAGFGLAVAIAGDTAVVGAGGEFEWSSPRGAAYVFHRSGSDWGAPATLAPTGETTGAYGHAVAISSDARTITVGMPLTADGPGRVFTFLDSAGTWTEGATLQGDGTPLSDDFGVAVAFDGSDAFVGAPYDGVGGAVYAFGVGDAIFAGTFDAPP